MGWNEINISIQNCKRCEISEQTPYKPIGKGSQKPKVLFIGLNPGTQEMKEKNVFVGRAGKLLNRWIKFLNLNNHNCAVINAIKCYTPNQSELTGEEINNCFPYLEQQVQLLNPEYIVALGDIVFKKLTNSSLSISEAEGSFFDNIFVMKHPSYYLRKGGHGWKENLSPLKKILSPNQGIQQYVSLHCHSEYSVGDGAGRLEDLIKYTKKQGFGSLALTDHGTIAGWYEFQKLCDENEIKPILGIEFYVARDYVEKTRKRYHVVALAKNQEGIQNIFKLNTISNTKGFYIKPRILLEDLYKYSEGLVVSSACTLGVISQRILDGEIEEAEDVAKKLHEVFKDDFYIELQPHYFPEQITVNPVLIDLINNEGIEPIITCDVHFKRKEDKEMQNAVRAITFNQKYGLSSLTGSTYCIMNTNELKKAALRTNITPELYEKAIRNTVKIAEKCNGRLPKYDTVMPKFEIPEDFK